MTSPLDEKGLEAAEVAWNSTDMGLRWKLSDAIRAYLSTAPAPDELEVVAWRYRPSHVPATAPWAYMDDREPSASFTTEALVTLSQAHSTIAALRAERDEANEAFKHLIVAMAQEHLGVGDKEGGGLFIRNNRAETAEAEVKRLTEDNEASRAERDKALSLINGSRP